MEYVIHGVKLEPGSPDNLIKCPDEEATMFSIYVKNPVNGEEQAVADYGSREEAERDLVEYQTAKPYSGTPLNVLPVQNLEQFAQLMTDWFNANMEQVNLASNPPDDVDIKATIDGTERKLTHQERQAFVAGLQMTAAIFDKLPFDIVEQPNG